MKISQFTDYSLRVLLYLGMKERLGTIGEIAKSFGVSNNHMVKVVHRLTQRGYVRSYKGKGGGIELAKNPESIRLGEFVSEHEPMELLECFNLATNTCPIQGVCGIEKALYNARKAFLDSLNEVTLADLLVANREKAERMRRLNISSLGRNRAG